MGTTVHGSSDCACARTGREVSNLMILCCKNYEKIFWEGEGGGCTETTNVK